MNTPLKILLGLIIAVILFHISVIIKVVPYDIAWGGQLQNDREMYGFEAVSIVINLLLGVIALIKAGYISFPYNRQIITGILWLFLVLFSINTVANLFSKTNLEKSFCILTLLFSVLICKVLNQGAATNQKAN